MKEDKQESGLVALWGKAVGVAFTVAFDQAMVLQLTDVVAELGKGVTGSLQIEGLKDSPVNIGGAPAGDC